MWHEALEEASRMYFGDHNVEGMLTTLQPLHAMLDKGPETLREVAFEQAFGRDLQEAMDWCKKYMRSKIESDLHQAWDLYTSGILFLHPFPHLFLFFFPLL
jgi:FKBP12-rapamycin complex-associated protein